MRGIGLLLAAALVAGVASADTKPRDLTRELAAAEKTRTLVAEKLSLREADLRDRVRALYKLSRAGDLPLWVDARARADVARRRAAARRMILRDLEERRVLREELERADRDVARLVAAAEEQQWADADPPEMVWPVSGDLEAAFGPYRDPGTRLRLARRGVELGCEPYEDILAVADGVVRYAGPVRNLGKAVIIDHGDGFVTVTGRLVATRVEKGYRVEAGVPIGDAAEGRIYLEVRRGGRPVDPAPLLRADD